MSAGSRFEDGFCKVFSKINGALKISLSNDYGISVIVKISIYLSIFLFLTGVWLSHGQLWAILKGTASLIRC